MWHTFTQRHATLNIREVIAKVIQQNNHQETSVHQKLVEADERANEINKEKCLKILRITFEKWIEEPLNGNLWFHHCKLMFTIWFSTLLLLLRLANGITTAESTHENHPKTSNYENERNYRKRLWWWIIWIKLLKIHLFTYREHFSC